MRLFARVAGTYVVALAFVEKLWNPFGGSYPPAAGAVLAGAVASAVAFLLLPVVEVSTSTRVAQTASTALKVALLVARPLIGLAVTRAINGL